MRKLTAMAVCAVLTWAGSASAASITVTMNETATSGVGPIIGTIVFQDSAQGLRILPNLSGLTEGQHGFHIHQNGSCDPADKGGNTVPGLAAGGHYDPAKTGKHEGPDGNGHLGDLPVLIVDANGNATRSSVAPRVKTSDLKDRAIMIHAGGDNYSDDPAALGGGGARAACGVVID